MALSLVGNGLQLLLAEKDHRITRDQAPQALLAPRCRLRLCSWKIAGHDPVMPHLRLNKVDLARDTELAKETLEWSKQLREGTGVAAQ